MLDHDSDPSGENRPWERRVPQVLSALGIGLAVGDLERVIAVNDTFCTLSGYSAEHLLDCVGLADLFGPGLRLRLAERRPGDPGHSDTPLRFHTELAGREGRRIPVEVSAQVSAFAGRPEVVATLLDLRERRIAEAELATRARQQAAVAEIGRQALIDGDLSSLLDAAVASVARTLDVEYVGVFELVPGGASFLLRAGLGWDEGMVGSAIIGAGVDSQAGFTVIFDTPAVTDDPASETRFGTPPLLSRHGVAAGTTVVIRGEREPYGVLGAHTTNHRRFGADDVHFLRAVANVLADAIARAGVERELGTRARQQAAVAELGRRALAEELSALLDATATSVACTLDVEYVKILQLWREDDTFVLRAGVGWEEGVVGHATVAAGLGSQGGFTLASAAPVVVIDLAHEARFRPPPLLLQHGVVSGMSVIIFGNQGPWGVLGAHTTSHRNFSVDDINFLEATANVLSESIRRDEAEGELRAAHDRERRLRQRIESHSRMVVEAQESERRRIARELHDEIGQTLTGLKLTLESCNALVATDADDRLRRARVMATDLLQRVHDLSLDLRPAMLDDLGLPPALFWLVERYSAQTGVQVALECSGVDRRLRSEVETAAYRIVQEALTNIARHAEVSCAMVRCSLTGDFLEVEVSDQGVGFETDAIASGKSSGLAGMEERARSTGGSFHLLSVPGMGTRVVAKLSIDDEPGSVP